MSTLTYQQALTEAAAILAQAGIEQPRREARLLASHALNLPPTTLPDPATPLNRTHFLTLVTRRAAHEPMAYITGHASFWSLTFQVSPATLIPRPDSETIVQAALDATPPGPTSVLDLGTGTGCLLLAFLHERPAAWGLGTDRNPAACTLAQTNARTLGLHTRASFAAADWAAPLQARFDLILSNPPYIESGEINTLMPEVARFEPPLALFAGPDGLAAYHHLIPELPRLLAPGGTACLELGLGQGPALQALAHQAGFTTPTLVNDLAGIPRALVLRA